MLQVKSGDLDKLGLLYERHKKRVFGFFYNMNQNPSLSEDLVQNVFVRMLKYRHTYSGEGSFLAWMFRTARNVNHDHFKKHRDTYPPNLAVLENTLVETDNIVTQMEKEDRVRLVRQGMMQLEEKQREVLVLSKFKEMKFSEIGEILGCSEGAAKVKAHRALKQLKEIMAKMEM